MRYNRSWQKKSYVLVRMVSSAKTGYFKIKKRNTKAEKLSLMGYDPKVRKHVLFNEKKV
jgi:large subunit ribosomal protein L33